MKISRCLWLVILGIAGCQEPRLGKERTAADGRPNNGAETAAQPSQRAEDPPETGFATVEAERYAWLRDRKGEALSSRTPPPPGFSRMPCEKGSFGAWLRGLPLRSGRPGVHLYNGLPKLNQRAHHAVVLIDVGERDLQQCADAVIRLRAEYLFQRGCVTAIAFHFTSGDLARWTAWRDGIRPHVRGNAVSWSETSTPDESYENFRKYLDAVFTYAGSASLSAELRPVSDPEKIEIGQVFIQGGFPGHAVIAVDVAEDASGNRVFLLAQSYMPAQEIHVLRNPESPSSPWYAATRHGELETPEWVFRYEDLKRFDSPRCGGD